MDNITIVSDSLKDRDNSLMAVVEIAKKVNKEIYLLNLHFNLSDNWDREIKEENKLSNISEANVRKFLLKLACKDILVINGYDKMSDVIKKYVDTVRGIVTIISVVDSIRYHESGDVLEVLKNHVGFLNKQEVILPVYSDEYWESLLVDRKISR